jgi:hypothetical protein
MPPPRRNTTGPLLQAREVVESDFNGRDMRGMRVAVL